MSRIYYPEEIAAMEAANPGMKFDRHGRLAPVDDSAYEGWDSWVQQHKNDYDGGYDYYDDARAFPGLDDMWRSYSNRRYGRVYDFGGLGTALNRAMDGFYHGDASSAGIDPQALERQFLGSIYRQDGTGGSSQAGAGADGLSIDPQALKRQFLDSIYRQDGSETGTALRDAAQMSGPYTPPKPKIGTVYSRWDPDSNSWYRTSNNPDEFQTLGRMDNWKWGQETPH